MDGSPARWIALIHQLHVAGEEGGSATMVAVFVPVVVVFWLLAHLFELIVCRKMVQNGRPSVAKAVTFWPTYACTIPIFTWWVYHAFSPRYYAYKHAHRVAEKNQVTL